jgi:hypothetical protein
MKRPPAKGAIVGVQLAETPGVTWSAVHCGPRSADAFETRMHDMFAAERARRGVDRLTEGEPTKEFLVEYQAFADDVVAAYLAGVDGVEGLPPNDRKEAVALYDYLRPAAQAALINGLISSQRPRLDD